METPVVIDSGAALTPGQLRLAEIYGQETRTGHTINQLIVSWLAGSAWSANTLEAYGRDLRQYVTWCAERGLDPLTVRLPDVQVYGAHLATLPGQRPGTALSRPAIARKLAAVSSWYRFLARADVVDHNPAQDAERPRYDRLHSPTQHFGARDAASMKAVSDQSPRRPGRTPGLSGLCAELALYLLVDLGIRASEACDLQLDDLSVRDGMRALTVRMKGGKIRERPVPTPLAPVLDAYLAQRPAPSDPTRADALLVMADGRCPDRYQVSRLVGRVARWAGVPNAAALTGHSARHAWNSMAEDAGADLGSRQAALGHAHSSTTARYSHATRSLAGDPAHLVAAVSAVPAQ